MLSLSFELSRSRVVAGQGHDLDLLVRVRAPAPPEGARRAPVCVLPLVDVSGSMQGEKLAGVRTALGLLAAHLQPGDHLGLAAFDTGAKVLVPVAELTESGRHAFLSAVSSLRARSSTNLAAGLLESLRELEARKPPPGARARVIALTDGRANCGPAVTPDDLRALVKNEFTQSSLSAFGYGNDCDQALLGDLAEAGGGSFAYVNNNDSLLTAFARELGGLVSTCASDVRLRVVPLAGAPTEERLGDVLFHGEVATVVRVAAPVRGTSVAIPIATLEASWRGSDGKQQHAELLVTLDYVPAEEADRVDLPAVAKVRDERLLRDAQAQAEEAVRRNDFEAAERILSEAAAKLRDPALVAFLREQVLPHYANARAYQEGTGRRSSVYQALKGKRMFSADAVVNARFAAGPSQAEEEMVRLFQGAAPKKADPDAPAKAKRPRKSKP